jgi:hypothetical protein
MGPFLALNLFIGGVFAFAAVHFGVMWWTSRRERLLLVIALLGLVGAALCAVLAVLLTTASPAVALQAVSLRYVAAGLAYILQVWIISMITGLRARPFVLLVTAWLSLAVVAMLLFSPRAELLFSIEQISLPWRERLWVPHFRPFGWWLRPLYFVVFFVELFGFLGASRMWGRDRLGALIVGVASTLGLARILLAANVDLLNSRWAYLGPAPTALWLLLISIQVSREQARTRERMLESERQARAVFDQTFQFAGLIAPDGTLLKANQTALRFAGVTEREVVGRPFWETPWWTHSREIQDRLRRGIALAAAGGTDNFEATHPGADGRLHFVDVSLKPALDEQGAVRHVIAEGRVVTERKEAEQALRESEARLRALSDNLPGSMVYQVVREPDGTMRFVYVSAAVERIHQLKADDVLRDSSLIYRQIPAGDAPRVAAAEAESLRLMQVFGVVTRMHRPDGTERWVQLSSAPRRLADGRVLWDGIETDITERMRADEALRESEERNRLMVEEVKDYAIFMLDPEGRIVTWNVGAERVYGYATEEVLGRHLSLFFTPEDVTAGFPALGLEVALREGHHAEEGWRTRKDGSRFWMTGSITPLRAPDGTLRGFAKVARDRTELKRSEALWRSIVDTTVEGVITIDEGGLIQSFNRAAETIFGWKEEEILGRSVAVLMPEPHRGDHARYLREYASTGAGRVIGVGAEVEGVRRDGSLFPMELSVGEYSFDQRRYFTGIVRDVTARRTLEQQLRQSQKMEAIGQLAGGVAHDFNNLLTVICGYADLLLLRTSSGDPGQNDVEQIRQAGERASALTRQLLAFSRQSVMEVRVLSLNAVVLNAEKMLRRVIGEHIELRVRLDPADLRIKADPDQLGQVLLNLAVNARDAMPNGGRLAIVSSHVDLDEAFVGSHPDFVTGTHVVLTVADEGTGMAPEVKARIFEPFFTTKEQGHGTGLGLAVVHGIVRQSGGNITVESEPQQGTSFRIYLPALREAEPALEAPAPLRPLEGHETILVVEDEAIVRDLAVTMLRRFGYEVLVARDGPEALRYGEDYQGVIDLLLTDVLMPGMNGPQLAAALRASRPGIRVLFMSGYTPDAMIRLGIAEGETELLKKPFSAQELAARLREVLEGARPVPSATQGPASR